MSWREEALCAQVDPELFFPDSMLPHAYAPAIRVCRICPVRENCLEDAMGREGAASSAYRGGVWGGLSPSQRATLARRRSRQDV